MGSSERGLESGDIPPLPRKIEIAGIFLQCVVKNVPSRRTVGSPAIEGEFRQNGGYDLTFELFSEK